MRTDPGMDRKPNLLFVFSDQHRSCDLGCYGNHGVYTPNLDRLAETGTRFTRCVANSPLCVPSRGSLLTGLYPWKHRALTNDLPIDFSVPSVAKALGEAGYRTGYIGKWHLGGIPRDRSIPPGERLGFDEWKGANCTHDYFHSYYFDEDERRHEIDGHGTLGFTELALDFIRRNSGGRRPWALFLSFGPPHDPYHAAPAEFLDMYRGTDIGLRPNVPDRIDEREVADRLRGYYALISLIDTEVGRLSEEIDDLGAAADTLLVYTSDHGDMLGSHGFWNKQLPYDESIMVPLIVSRPGHVPRQTRNGLIGLVDLPATLLALLGVEPGYAMDGLDLSRLLRIEGSGARESCLVFDSVPCHQAADRGGDSWMGVRTPRYTYARHADDEGFVLFDNYEDPFQTRNLILEDDERELVETMRERTDRLAAEAGIEFTGWKSTLENLGLSDEWNRSQRYFNRPELPGGP